MVGAGAFGAWTAYQLRRTGRSVMLVDQFGAGNSRSSSGGESRVIRAGYGDQEIYTRWTIQSLDLWQRLFRDARQDLFVKTGVLWLGQKEDPLIDDTTTVLQRVGVKIELLARADLERRYPQIALGTATRGVLEPESGVLLARRAVQALVQEAVRHGVEHRIDAVVPPPGGARLDAVTTSTGERLGAGLFVFACGPWLPKMFPGLLGTALHVTRQEVFFFGPEPGDRRFAPGSMPVWIDLHDGVYALPDIEARGVKVGLDHRQHGPAFDADHSDRMTSGTGLFAARRLLASKIPSLRDAKLLESHVCQYTNTTSGDFLIDRHPELENVWVVGGGSGHGFKHGPAVGEYVTGLMTNGGHPDRRFRLASAQVGAGKQTVA